MTAEPRLPVSQRLEDYHQALQKAAEKLRAFPDACSLAADALESLRNEEFMRNPPSKSPTTGSSSSPIRVPVGSPVIMPVGAAGASSPQLRQNPKPPTAGAGSLGADDALHEAEVRMTLAFQFLSLYCGYLKLRGYEPEKHVRFNRDLERAKAVLARLKAAGEAVEARREAGETGTGQAAGTGGSLGDAGAAKAAGA